jgi:hypothetical protein
MRRWQCLDATSAVILVSKACAMSETPGPGFCLCGRHAPSWKVAKETGAP